MQLTLLAGLVALSVPIIAAAEEPVSAPAVKLSPQIREMERDQAYFDNIDCRRLHQVRARDEREALYLKRRKQVCLETYRAFIPRP